MTGVWWEGGDEMGGENETAVEVEDTATGARVRVAGQGRGGDGDEPISSSVASPPSRMPSIVPNRI